ncbi:hypothetical protein AM571_CH02783 [Rhizobium etli 8C-3]|uniref:Uncharacterized protein n=1 Tax=Rhizobium etli 8C-3 TaxID=538025 RepID=A0A1L5P621_RHIET|nr:hypothetical protein AM571_CH02783 [Rhizobium etli 8C-3]
MLRLRKEITIQGPSSPNRSRNRRRLRFSSGFSDLSCWTGFLQERNDHIGIADVWRSLGFLIILADDALARCSSSI